MSEPSQSPKVVVVAVDSSKHSERAFQWFARQPGASQSTILLVHILQPELLYTGTPYASDAQPDNRKDLLRLCHQKARKMEEHYLDTCRAHKLHCRFHLYDSGDPGVNIVQAAKAHKANCVVIGSRGLDPIRRTILGSVSDYVLRHCHLPTIIVPPPADDS